MWPWQNISLSLALVVLGLSSGCSLLFRASSEEEVQQTCDPEACEAAGGVCSLTEQCDLDCRGDVCACPRGLDCRITITEEFEGEVDCSQATNCDVRCVSDAGCGSLQLDCGLDCSVQCIGEYSCNFGLAVLCGAGACELSCTGKGSCQNATVSCGTTEECDLRCPGLSCGNVNFDCQDAEVCGMQCTSIDSCVDANLTCEEPTQCSYDCFPGPQSPCG